ncbi:MAG: hypothetical protein PUP91_38545 [Rhizonema sp. PD37]|nr:hypothetical protein [Rhizonema sp. PD37]
MTRSPQPKPELTVLGKFASIVGLLGAALFFAGWIYRWSYFYFFQLEVTSLDFPAQSFLFVPLQIFFGNGWALCRTVLAFILTTFLILLSLWLLRIVSAFLVFKLQKRFLSTRKVHTNHRQRSWFAKQIRSWALFNYVQLRSIRAMRSFLNEIIIVSWMLFVLFWLSQWQGTVDARRDASPQSTLPVVALITPEEKFALGRKLDNMFANPALKGYKIIGDRGLVEDIHGKEDTDTSNPKQPRVWRLLLERGGWIYLFQALPANATFDQRPLVLAVQESEKGHLLIRSPEVSKSTSP